VDIKFVVAVQLAVTNIIMYGKKIFLISIVKRIHFLIMIWLEACLQICQEPARGIK
jgi:hypothetical protein